MTNDQHLELWDEEVTEWIESQPRPLARLGMWLLMLVVSLLGIAMLLALLAVIIYFAVFVTGMAFALSTPVSS